MNGKKNTNSSGEQKNKVKLNLGCGKDTKPDYINIDIFPFKGVSYVYDVRKLHYSDGTIDEILAIHVIESFYRWELEDVLKEWFRVLKGGGFLEIEFTELDKCVEMYQKSDRDDQFSKARCGFFGGQKTPILYTLNYHKYVWREKEIVQLLKKVGFRIVKKATGVQHVPERDSRLLAYK